MLFTRLLPLIIFVALHATSVAQAQATLPADTVRTTSRPQLNTLPPATRSGTPVAAPFALSQVVETPPALTAGLSLGWGAPYAAGVEVAYRFQPSLDGNIGVGIGSSGAKVGGGVRYYVPSRTRNQLFVGTNLVYSYADIDFDLEMDGVQGRYRMHSSTLLHVRAGLHHQYRRNAMQFALGYGAILAPQAAIEFIPGFGPGSTTMRDIAKLVGPGGAEVSISFLFGLGRIKRAVR
ncbi:hypothetical protein [Hymenobacter norwichensis]|uniref:hypothetical protein n=1 Tax=Hymenobacter norwichensis TaxID=223903 RepID=UPI0003B70E90|nr:hypothetical protein [Hymenobacter norwichensis]